MEVNVSSEIKGAGQPVVSTVEMEDQVKPQVAPVEKSGDSAQGSLNDQALHSREAQKPSPESLRKLAKEIQDRFDAMGSELGFSVNEETEDVVIEVRKPKTGELIRQIPSEEVLALREKLDELVGILFDKQV